MPFGLSPPMPLFLKRESLAISSTCLNLSRLVDKHCQSQRHIAYVLNAILSVKPFF